MELNKFNRFFNTELASDDDYCAKDYFLTNYENGAFLYNCYICYKYRFSLLNFGEYSTFETEFFKAKGILDKEMFILVIYCRIVSFSINELTIFEITKILNNKTWMCTNLDSLYNILLPELELSLEELRKLFPRLKNNDVLQQVLNIKFIIRTLYRDSKIRFVSKSLSEKSVVDVDLFILLDEIKFIKGYKICYDSSTFSVLKDLIYLYKLPLKKPVLICHKKEMTVEDYLNNKSFSSPIWIRNINLKLIDKSFLMEKVEPLEFTEVLNWLNFTPFRTNYKLLAIYLERSYDPSQQDWRMISKFNLLGNILSTTTEYDAGVFSIESLSDLDKNKASMNACVLDLIEKQSKRISKYWDGVWFSEHLEDSRGRIFQKAWPLNYQLNHIVRNTLRIENKNNLSKLSKDLFSNCFIKEHINFEWNLFYYQKIDVKKFIKFINTKTNWKLNNKNWLEIESILTLVNAISPDKKFGIVNKTEWFYDNFDRLVNINWSKDWTSIKEEFNFKNKDMLKFIGYVETLKDLKGNIFKNMYWGDASNNVLQLISFRLEIYNETMLRLFNIFENNTKYDGAYSYVSDKLKETWDTFSTKFPNTLSEKEFLNLIKKEDVKRVIMPSCYGMTKYSCREELKSEFDNRIDLISWKDLNKKTQILIIDFIREEMFNCLKMLDFDIQVYIDLFDKIPVKNNYYWFADNKKPIVIQCLKKSKRSKYLFDKRKLDRQVYLVKKTDNLVNKDDTLKLLKTEIDKVNKKLSEDDKIFYHRIKVEFGNKNITIRLQKKSEEINWKEVNLARIPGSIHSYDSSILNKSIYILKKLNIKVAPIHDSLGSCIIYAPIVRIVFLAVNIYYLKLNNERSIYPFDKTTNFNEDYFRKIAESTNFFK